MQAKKKKALSGKPFLYGFLVLIVLTCVCACWEPSSPSGKVSWVDSPTTHSAGFDTNKGRIAACCALQEDNHCLLMFLALDKPIDKNFSTSLKAGKSPEEIQIINELGIIPGLVMHTTKQETYFTLNGTRVQAEDGAVIFVDSDNSRYCVLEGVKWSSESLGDVGTEKWGAFVKKVVEESTRIPEAKADPDPPETPPATEEPTIQFHFGPSS